jgi:hypothetical protein
MVLMQKLETAIWMLIFGGLVLLGLGLAVQPNDTGLGWGMIVAGAVVTAIGVLLIVVRARAGDRS